MDMKSKLANLQKTHSKGEIDSAKEFIVGLIKQYSDLGGDESYKQILLYSYLTYGEQTIVSNIKKFYSAPPIPAGMKGTLTPAKMFIAYLKSIISREDAMKEIYVLNIGRENVLPKNTQYGGKRKADLPERVISFYIPNLKKIASSMVFGADMNKVADLTVGRYKTLFTEQTDGKIFLVSPISFVKLSDDGFQMSEIIDASMSQYPNLVPPYDMFFGEDGKKVTTVYFAGMLLPSTIGKGYILVDGKNEENLTIYPGQDVQITEGDYVFGVGNLLKDLTKDPTGEEFKIYPTFITRLMSTLSATETPATSPNNEESGSMDNVF